MARSDRRAVARLRGYGHRALSTDSKIDRCRWCDIPSIRRGAPIAGALPRNRIEYLVISFDHVSKQYGSKQYGSKRYGARRDGDGTFAVHDVTLTVESRSVTAFVGSSGSGKTTLLRMINRMVDPTSGSVAIDGEDVAKRNPVELRRHIGYVMQNTGLLPHRTVQDNIATVPMLSGTSKRVARHQAGELMERVGLDPTLTTRYPAQLSGGQQQRVGVARALANDPLILLMDEPFGAVDPLVRVDLQEELLRLQREEARTIVFVTHDIDEAFLLGDQVALFNTGGALEQLDTPEQMLAHPTSEFVRDFIDAGRPRSPALTSSSTSSSTTTGSTISRAAAR